MQLRCARLGSSSRCQTALDDQWDRSHGCASKTEVDHVTSNNTPRHVDGTTLLASGIAVAASEQHQQDNAASGKLTKTEQDFGKLSADGARAFQDLALTRLAIFEGHADQAKKLAGEADAALNKAKGDEATFIKADSSLSAPPQAAGQSATPAKEWLPVDGVISLDEDYSASPAKAKAVAEANEHLRKGDRKAAIEKLKLADVGMSVVQEILPLRQTIADVHQAATLIDQGKFYEGSQALRKVQASARFDVATYVAGSGGKITYAHMSDAKALDAGQKAATQHAAGQQPQQPQLRRRRTVRSPTARLIRNISR